MNVGVDIDGVITNLDFIKSSKKEKHTILDTNPAVTYKNNSLINFCLFKGISFYSKHAIIRNEASDIIKDLKNNGSRIHIITKRQFASENSPRGEKIRNLTKLHLLNHDIPYDTISFTDGNKLKECLDLNIDVMIEDNPDAIKHLSLFIPVIVFDTPYNQGILGDNIYRAHDWLAVKKIIDELNHKKYVLERTKK